jgi:hypothetical protein
MSYWPCCAAPSSLMRHSASAAAAPACRNALLRARTFSPALLRVCPSSVCSHLAEPHCTGSCHLVRSSPEQSKPNKAQHIRMQLVESYGQCAGAFHLHLQETGPSPTNRLISRNSTQAGLHSNKPANAMPYLCDASRVALQPQQLLPCAPIKQADAPAVAASCKQVGLKRVEG